MRTGGKGYLRQRGGGVRAAVSSYWRLELIVAGQRSGGCRAVGLCGCWCGITKERGRGRGWKRERIEYNRVGKLRVGFRPSQCPASVVVLHKCM